MPNSPAYWDIHNHGKWIAIVNNVDSKDLHLYAIDNCLIFRDDKNNKFVMEEQIRMLNEKYGADIRLLETPVMDVSSSELRQMIKNQEDVSAYLPEEVATFIKENGLYRN